MATPVEISLGIATAQPVNKTPQTVKRPRRLFAPSFNKLALMAQGVQQRNLKNFTDNGGAQPAVDVPRARDAEKRAARKTRLLNAPRPLPLAKRKVVLAKKLAAAGLRQPAELLTRKRRERTTATA